MTLNILALAKQVEELVKNGGSGGTSDYEQLSKKPKINDHTLIGNKSAHDLGLATEEAVGAKSAKADIATEFSTETSYTAGNYVYYEGTLYIFNVDHAAGAWDIADVAVANVTDEVTSNKAAIDALDTAVSGKSTVTANPAGTSAGDLSSIGINGTKYNIPSGGGSDIPAYPDIRGYFLKTAQGNDGIELEWENFKDNVKDIVNPIFQNDSFYVGKVLTRYGTGINDYGWEDAPGASETLLFDDIVYVDSQSTGAGWAEIPLADRVELFDSNGLLIFHRVHMEVSFVTEMRSDVRSRTENFSCDFDLDRILVTDAQDYSDPEYSTVNDDNAQAYTYHHYLVGSGGNYAENAIEVNLNFNLFGTNPAPAVNTFAGRLKGLYFENRLVSTGAYQALPSEQGIRVKITAK